jgi:hypothetical protein
VTINESEQKQIRGVSRASGEVTPHDARDYGLGGSVTPSLSNPQQLTVPPARMPQPKA